MARAIASARLCQGFRRLTLRGPSLRTSTSTKLFEQANWIVQAVMISSRSCSSSGCTSSSRSGLYIGRASGSRQRFIESFWKSRDIEQIYKQAQALRNSPISQMFVAGYTELAKLQSMTRSKAIAKATSRTSSARCGAHNRRDHEARIDDPFFATTGSAAPFIGLFGTVIGILFAFLDIARARSIGGIAQDRRPAHRRGAVRDRDRPRRGDPGGDGLQLLQRRIRVLRSEMEMFEQDYLNIIKRHFLR